MHVVLLIAALVAAGLLIGVAALLVMRKRLREAALSAVRHVGARPAAAQCPHLGLATDPFSRDTHANDEHRCYAHLGRERIDLQHQRRFCLASTHNRCPFLMVSPQAEQQDRLAQARAWWRSVSPARPALTAAQLGESAGLGAAAGQLALHYVRALGMVIVQTWRAARPHTAAHAHVAELTEAHLMEAKEPMVVTDFEPAVMLAELDSPVAVQQAHSADAWTDAHSADAWTDSEHAVAVSTEAQSAAAWADAHSAAAWSDVEPAVVSSELSSRLAAHAALSVSAPPPSQWNSDTRTEAAAPAGRAPKPQQADELVAQGIAAVEAGAELEGYALFKRATELDSGHARGWFWRAKTAETLDEVVECLKKANALDPTNSLIASNLDWARERRDAARQAAKAKSKAPSEPAPVQPPLYQKHKNGNSLAKRLLETILDLVHAVAAMAAFALAAAWLLSGLPLQIREGVLSATGLTSLPFPLPDAGRLTSLVHVPLGGGYDLSSALPYGIGFMALFVGFGLMSREGWSRVWAPILAVASFWLLAG